MMAHTSTAEIDRSISRFISRGNEIAKHEPTTSYYCKLRATELLMETKPRPDDLIRKLLEELEVRFFFYAFGCFSFLSFLCVFSPRRCAWSSLRDDARYEDVIPLLLLLLFFPFFLSLERDEMVAKISRPSRLPLTD